MGAKALASAKNEKAAAQILFDIVGLENEKYRLGRRSCTPTLGDIRQNVAM